MLLKTCISCEKEKPITEFHKQKQNRLGVDQRCKPCRSIHQAEQYKEKWFEYFCRGKKSESVQKALPFNLTPEYLKDIWTDTCPVYKVPFVRFDRSSPHSPTLDRIEPSLGYVKGNVVFISARANRIKYDASLTELKLIVEWLEGATTIPKGSTLK
jgi:hypothetical protein